MLGTSIHRGCPDVECSPNGPIVKPLIKQDTYASLNFFAERAYTQVLNNLHFQIWGKLASRGDMGTFEEPAFSREFFEPGFTPLSPARRMRDCGCKSSCPGKPEQDPILVNA